MPTVPIRGVGEIGVISDQTPSDLPLNAWQKARNLRFADGAISRTSAFKFFDEPYTYSKRPVGIIEGGGTAGAGYLVTVFEDGTMEQRNSGQTTDVTPVTAVSSNTNQITSCFLGGVTYVNRRTDLPLYRLNPSDGAFTAITGWSASDRCQSLRSFKDFLIAVNVQKGATTYPVMVKWSDAAQAGAPPDNWDTANLSSLAGETILNDCRDSLVDSATLSDLNILYGETQTFRMDFIGAPLVFRFQKIFDDVGAIAENCVVEVDGRHYVFAQSDIFMHDGFSKQSIVSGRNAEYIFKNLDFASRDRCFVYHDRQRGEIAFCYPSASNDCQVPLDQSNGCNEAAIYNYRFNTWTFVDLPSAIGTAYSSQSSEITWEDTNEWNTETGSWLSFDGRRFSSLVLAATGFNTVVGKTYFVDDLDGGYLSNLPDPDVLWPAYGEWQYKDMDDFGKPLYGRALIKRIVPQFYTSDPDASVIIQFGQASRINSAIDWKPPYTMAVWEEDKYDTRISDRYLSMRIEMPIGVDVSFGGFDLDVVLISKR